jgi:hypothetical protein
MLTLISLAVHLEVGFRWGQFVHKKTVSEQFVNVFDAGVANGRSHMS